MQTCNLKKHRTSLLDLQFVNHLEHTPRIQIVTQTKEREKDDINVDQSELEKKSFCRRTGRRLMDMHYYTHLRSTTTTSS